MEPPSPELVRTLRDLNLCGSEEFRKAARLAKDLASDLPTFDSVWIDALVQLRCLTHFQATCLDAQAGDRLRIGSFVLVRHLGRDSWYDHYEATWPGETSRYLLSLLDCAGRNPAMLLDRVQTVISELSDLTDPGILVPRLAELADDRLLVCSPFPEERDLREFVVRRGRWPAPLVRELATQAALSLMHLEDRGLCHGDLRLETVRLSRTGSVLLTLPAILATVSPELTIHADLTPECLECLAPERVGVGSTATSASDQYSLGCLMWSLLTGRSPYLSADPLTKLARHRTCRLQDVRELAPDTSDELWTIIKRLTAPLPQDRYENWRAVVSQFGRPAARGRRRLSHFVQSFSRRARLSAAEVGKAASGTNSSSRGSRGFGLVVCVLLLFCWWMLPAGRQVLLSLHSEPVRQSQEMDPDQPAEIRTAEGPAASSTSANSIAVTSLPTPDAQGVILLSHVGPWSTGTIQSLRAVHVRGAPGVLPRILVQDDSLRLEAPQVTLENVLIERLPSEGTRPLIELRCGTCDLRQVALVDRFTPLPLTVWETPEAGDWTCRDSLFVSRGPVIQSHWGAKRARLENSLHVGDGALLEFLSGNASAAPTSAQVATTLELVCSHLTARLSGPLVVLPADWPIDAGMSLEVNDSILEFSNGRAWIELLGGGLAPQWQERISLTGEGTVSTSGPLLGYRRSPGASLERLEESDLQIEGSFAGEFAFVASPSLRPRDSHLARFDSFAPRRSPLAPGIDAASLPDASAPHITRDEHE